MEHRLDSAFAAHGAQGGIGRVSVRRLCRGFAGGLPAVAAPSGTLRVMSTAHSRPFMLRTALPVALVAAVAAGAPAQAAAPASAAALQEFEGTVVSVNRDNRTFRLRDSERGTVRIKVNRRTRYERIAGFSALRKGMRNIEVTARRADGRWLAIDVERSGGGGDHGGGDD